CFFFLFFIFRLFFFHNSLHFRCCTLLNVLFPMFSFFVFYFPTRFFSQIAAFPEFCALECLISKVFIFRFLASQKLFFAKRCISGVLHSGMSYFQSFHFSIFSFPEAFFLQSAAFPEFFTVECFISKYLIYRFLVSQNFFFFSFFFFSWFFLFFIFFFPIFFFFFFFFPVSFFF